ncbi:actin-binding LIM protein 1-like isoform X2 [Genypterus blacodes]|uniref:actin-binding LIM protein 1-like isoform X2 n=1 Tax=Genypterus blacodes TaxID=154954 RepID=UPI003F75ACA0
MKDKALHSQDGSLPSSPAGKRLILCHRCGEPCRGEVLRLQSSHFHIKCFSCKVCGCDLACSGFYMRDGEHLCPLDFQRLHGTLCHHCGEFVEGEMVTALGKNYHPACFVCTACKRPFPAGGRVTFTGKNSLCQRCIPPVSSSPKHILSSSNCSGCGREIKNGQALLAVGGQWHLGCFKCKACGKVLSAEYISKDGVPYCERDYQAQFGIQCDACRMFITGKVLEAGEKHYHPSCARCSRCGNMFTEGQEMFVQGSTVWHPGCRGSSSSTEDRCMPNRSSSEGSCSRPGSCTPGSPGRSICAKVDEEIIDYRDLAAIPRVKAIYEIEHPDAMTYESQSNSNDNIKSTLDIKGSRQDRQSPAESQGTSSRTEDCYDLTKCPIPRSASHGCVGLRALYSRHSYNPTLLRSPQHFHRPDQGFNMYNRPPIYKQQDSISPTSQTASLPGYGRNDLSPTPSPDFSHYNGDRDRGKYFIPLVIHYNFNWNML